MLTAINYCQIHTIKSGIYKQEQFKQECELELLVIGFFLFNAF